MRTWGVLVLSLACGSAEGIHPEPGLPVAPLLRPPFDGDFPLTNPFDHRAPPLLPGEGEVLDRFGRSALGTRGHRAYDWGLPVGTPVRSAGRGFVVQAGPVPPFFCALRGREVADQLAVVVEHRGPGGEIWRTGYHHLSNVVVRVGAELEAGDLLGDAGASGCAEGPHLHFTVERRVGEADVPVDPYGWTPGSTDPWEETTGQASTWLWELGKAPRWLRERAVTTDAATRIRRVRYQVWPGQPDEIELQSDRPLAGWSLRVDGVTRWTGGPEEGPGTVTPRLDPPDLPDAGGVAVLVDPQDVVQQELRWGLASRRSPEPAGAPAACPDVGLGCLPVPARGPVRSPVWSPDGRWLAIIVGELGARRLVVVELGDGWTTAHAADTDEDVGAVGWIEGSTVVYDAKDDDGHRRPGYLSPGLVGAPAFPADRLPGDLALRDARDGRMLLDSVAGLHLWRLGAREPTRLTGPAAVATLGADRVWWVAGTEVFSGPLGGGAVRVASPRGEVGALVARGDRAAWRSEGAWWVAGDPVALTASAVAFVDAGVVAARGRELWLGDRVVASLPVEADEIAVWSTGAALRVAYTARFSDGLPTALGLVRIELTRPR